MLNGEVGANEDVEIGVDLGVWSHGRDTPMRVSDCQEKSGLRNLVI